MTGKRKRTILFDELKKEDLTKEEKSELSEWFLTTQVCPECSEKLCVMTGDRNKCVDLMRIAMFGKRKI